MDITASEKKQLVTWYRLVDNGTVSLSSITVCSVFPASYVEEQALRELQNGCVTRCKIIRSFH
jgi:hypothetical protein